MLTENEKPPEIWRDIKGYEGYYMISNYGNVKSLYMRRNKTREMLKPSKSTTGYFKIELVKNKQRHGYKIHRLVAKAFIPNHDNKPCVNHKDGNKLNNSVENLEWCTVSENINHAYSLGLIPKYNIPDARLRELYVNQKLTAKEIAALYQVSEMAIYSRLQKMGIARRKAEEWKNIYSIPLENLLEDLRQNKTNKELAKKYNCSTGIIATRKSQFKKRGMLNA